MVINKRLFNLIALILTIFLMIDGVLGRSFLNNEEMPSEIGLKVNLIISKLIFIKLINSINMGRAF